MRRGLFSSAVAATLLALLLAGSGTAAYAQSCLGGGGDDDDHDEQQYGFRSIRPSDVDPSRVPPNVTLANNVNATFITNVPHLVLPPPNAGDDPQQQVLKVFVPGTTDTPEGASCLLASLLPGPVIGLSYAFINSPDGYRNGACFEKYGAAALVADNNTGTGGNAGNNSSSSEELSDDGNTGDNDNDNYYARCLARQHEDALWGGASETDIWQDVDVRDSVFGRLRSLLLFLSNEYPSEGWDSYYIGTADDAMWLRWDRIWVVGHSQGAGHAAYLAKTTALAGAGLISGPQDDCVQGGADAVCWTRGDYLTADVRMFAHADESDIGTIRDNWGDNAGEPVTISDAKSLLETDDDDTVPAGRPWLTSIEPQVDAACASFSRENHCSTALDNNAPLISEQNVSSSLGGGNPYLYSRKIWPGLAGGGESGNSQGSSAASVALGAWFPAGFAAVAVVWIVNL